MRRLFDDFADGEYNRPNERWVCGNADESCACPFGPSAAGKCPELGECQPVKQGDRWRCNRPATRGGSCEDETGGPTPDGQCCRVNKCQPQRSHRTRRGRLAVGVTMFAAGLLCLLFGSPWRSEVLAPGPLTQQHAQLLAQGDWSNRCSACHTDQDRPLLTLAIGSLAGTRTQDVTQSHLCMNCHKKQIDSKSFLLAHGLPKGALESSDGGQVACAACHREHHGAMHNLTKLSTARCQSCHKQQYDSFAGSHPDFGAWPYKRRTRIAFDHAKHMNKHFAEKQQTFDCAACHVEGPSGGAMLLANYQSACSECHDQGIRTSAAEGLAVLSFPMLDPDALADHDLKIDKWPAHAEGDFDGELSAPHKLLLADEPALGLLLNKYGPAFSFYDIDPDSEEDARGAAALANATAGLVESIKSKGQSAILKKLAAVAGRQLTGEEAAALTSGLPVDLIDQAAADWFGGKAPDSPAAPIDKAAKQPAGGWFKSDATLSLYYTPTGHADPLLRSWIDLIVSLDDSRKVIRESALAELATPKSPGQCLMCHSTERGAGGRLIVNWHPLDAAQKPRGFTRFAHGPHTTTKQLADCQACHRINNTANTTASYATLDPHAFASEFEPITKADCSSCHVPRAAGDSCTQCHNYHVQPSGWPK